MHFSQLTVVLAALAASAQGFKIPEGTPDGIYMVGLNETGHEVHQRLADPEPVPVSQSTPISVRKRALDKRDWVGCAGGPELDHRNTDDANADLDRQCGGGAFVPAGWNFYAIRGTTVAYFCNWGGGNQCDAGTRQRTSARITAACGWYKPGRVQVDEYALAYGYDWANTDFCRRW